MNGSVLLRDVIHIPERAGAEDYVLKLTEGVGKGRLEETIREYVVTEDLAKAFGEALDRVSASLADGASRAAFLSGSFGSGKSHFMAVLYALLGEHPIARAEPKLAPVIAAHDARLQGKRILRLTFHFLDADSIEQCILGGYVAQVRALHPEAPLPAV
ncbi:MAG: phage resistance protein, partial [Chloroflexi bacterium]|nr:phage resistance protein [Chloroflexota bacterium]